MNMYVVVHLRGLGIIITVRSATSVRLLVTHVLEKMSSFGTKSNLIHPSLGLITLM